MLKSGLVDRHTAEFMEHVGIIPEGASEQVREDALKDASMAQLTKLADELTDEVEKSMALRETALDLERLRWPVVVCVYKTTKPGAEDPYVWSGSGVIDRQGRYYFRVQDIDPAIFVPGYQLVRNSKTEVIAESQILHIDDKPVCVQVSTQEP
jgi:hypothetical protein